MPLPSHHHGQVRCGGWGRCRTYQAKVMSPRLCTMHSTRSRQRPRRILVLLRSPPEQVEPAMPGNNDNIGSRTGRPQADRTWPVRLMGTPHHALGTKSVQAWAGGHSSARYFRFRLKPAFGPSQKAARHKKVFRQRAAASFKSASSIRGISAAAPWTASLDYSPSWTSLAVHGDGR